MGRRGGGIVADDRVRVILKVAIGGRRSFGYIDRLWGSRNYVASSRRRASNPVSQHRNPPNSTTSSPKFRQSIRVVRGASEWRARSKYYDKCSQSASHGLERLSWVLMRLRITFRKPAGKFGVSLWSIKVYGELKLIA